MTKSGRREAARTAEVAYMLYESLYTQRMTRLAVLSEKVKLAGLGASEASRIRQYERWIGDSIENLRMIKSYRTPQTLRSFTRIFATLLPPFFAPTFAQLGFTTGSLGYGVTFAVITSLCLNALVEGIDILEDPFVGFVTLDGIDVREEFQVLHYQQLITARNNLYKDERKYGEKDVISVGMLEDIEAQMPASKKIEFSTQDANDTVEPMDASERSLSRSQHRLRALISFGDANLLDGADDITSRESGYQIAGRKTTTHPFFKHHNLAEGLLDSSSSQRSRRSRRSKVTFSNHSETSFFEPDRKVDAHGELDGTELVDVSEEDNSDSSQQIRGNSDHTVPHTNCSRSRSSPPPLDSVSQEDDSVETMST